MENNVLTVSAQKETRSGFEPSAANQSNDLNQNSSPTEDGTVNQTSGETTTDAGANQNTEISNAFGGTSTGVQTAKPSTPQRYTRQEFSYTSFQRSFTLPEATEPEQISANYQDGILTITVPKKQRNQSNAKRTINIA